MHNNVTRQSARPGRLLLGWQGDEWRKPQDVPPSYRLLTTLVKHGTKSLKKAQR